jgi:hypothetical protein
MEICVFLTVPCSGFVFNSACDSCATYGGTPIISHNKIVYLRMCVSEVPAK